MSRNHYSHLTLMPPDIRGHDKGTGLFRVHAFVPTSGKYKNRRPLPQENSFVCVSGFLTTLLAAETEAKGVQFEVRVHDMVFGGRVAVSKDSGM